MIKKQIIEQHEVEKYMARCIQLARCGEGNVSPNPMVGAVIVHNHKIIGEGYHRKCGEAHAEVNAIASVKDQSLLANATIYVSLEPCSHYGKTPPCSLLIIEKKIPKVVIATLDPFPEVSGRGVNMLREAGIEVTVGVLEQKAQDLNKRFFWFHTHKQPYIILKWAESADGYMDIKRETPETAPIQLSTEVTRRRVHKLRSEVDAIMVGRRTALLDCPSLTTRYWFGKNPTRILVDRNLSIPQTSPLYNGDAPTLIFTFAAHTTHPNVEFILLDETESIIEQVKSTLYSKNLHTLMVEGGAFLLNLFLDEGVNEIRIERTTKQIKEGVSAPIVTYPVTKIEKDDHSIFYFYENK
jgi:diaminohydroxyphosphoribosylaminopyrimidine deaminase/5-amino-6-(5-phosphoribosylamino)uracil reductase